MPTLQPPLRDLLDRAVAAGILSTDQAAAVAALDAQPAAGARRGAVLAEVLGYVGGALAVVAALFLGAELWDELGPWPRVLLLAAVAAACLVGGAALGGREGAPGRLGGFLWAAAVVAVAGTAGVGADGLFDVRPGTAALVAAAAALVVAAVLWWLAAGGAAARRDLRRGRRDAADRARPYRRRHLRLGRPAAVGVRAGVAGRVGPADRRCVAARRAGLGTRRPRRRRRPAVRPERPRRLARRRAPSAPPRSSSPGSGPGARGSPRSVSAGCSCRCPWPWRSCSTPASARSSGILAVGLALVAAAVVLTRRAAR